MRTAYCSLRTEALMRLLAWWLPLARDSCHPAPWLQVYSEAVAAPSWFGAKLVQVGDRAVGSSAGEGGSWRQT